MKKLDDVAKTIIWCFTIVIVLSLLCFAIVTKNRPQGSMTLFIPDGDPQVLVVRDIDGEVIFNITQEGEVWHRGYMLVQDEELSYIIGRDNQRRWNAGQSIFGDEKLQEKVRENRARELTHKFGDDRDTFGEQP